MFVCAGLGGDGMIRRRIIMAMEMEEDEVKEWELIEDITVEAGTTQIKIPVDNYKEYIIFGKIVAESNKALYVTANRESYDWVTRRIANISNGVNTNKNKKFYIKINKITNDYIEVHISFGFEGAIAMNETIYMRECDSSIKLIEYFWFSASDSSEFTDGNIKIFAR